ncbi:hypothetical protein SUGI_0342000 [Cryptomeria japonica]|uniref:uncharacterized protein LOC131874854 n=1 Tax=Cryptomeria japonica TaxID=3369 RepID=UPI002408AA81|nr:uncharacterized protein LOC131874854 [Cryptomeria japonica]GLJ19053.1 hypothetical protein SUGI_0342000 [Cryptomeria japonica]
MLQLVLIVLGPRRYHSSNAIFRFVLWGAYISADAVSICALGSMMHSARSGIYGIWAPLLLLHLGAPDAITAYSMADNELWLRHAFIMVYQVAAAVYVMYSSALKGHALASAILLLVAGAIKYGEKPLALWFSSFPQIFRSCLPISKYMKNGNVVESCRYIVMGEGQLQRARANEKNSSSLGGGVKQTEGSLETSSVEEGTKKAEVSIEASSHEEGRRIITIEDIKSAKIKERNYNLCLAYALFKMYKRRFASLDFDEVGVPETRAFWLKFSGKEAFRIVELELKFMYDELFSKWKEVTFSSFLTVLRLVNCILMGASVFLIWREKQHREAQRTVTYVVISVALVAEVFQFFRIMISDWTMVRLVCAHVEAFKHPLSQSTLNWCKICMLKVLEIAELVLGKVQNVVRRDTFEIRQHCLIGTCLGKSRFVWKMAGFFPKFNRHIVSVYIKVRHIHKVSVQDELKDFIFDILKQKISLQNDIEKCRRNIYMFEEDEFGIFKEGSYNLEEVILRLHVTTTMLDMKRALLEQIEDENVRLSRVLSRYCSYLLLSRPNLLPLHPEKARIVYMQHVERIVEMHESLLRPSGKRSQYHYMEPISKEVNNALAEAIGIPLELLGKEENEEERKRGYVKWKRNQEEKREKKDKEKRISTRDEDMEEARIIGYEEWKRKEEENRKKKDEERWTLLAEYWGRLVIYMAVYNKTSSHAECMADGGEFLSQVWVLLGHMGCGDQSEAAVKLKVEARMKQEQRMERQLRVGMEGKSPNILMPITDSGEQSICHEIEVDGPMEWARMERMEKESNVE